MLIFEDAKGLELSSTLDCGQCFRWLPQKEVWQGVAEGRSVLAYTKGNALILEGAEEEDREFWANYFALDLDYPALQERFCAGNRRLKLCVEENPGIRVLPAHRRRRLPLSRTRLPSTPSVTSTLWLPSRLRWRRANNPDPKSFQLQLLKKNLI